MNSTFWKILAVSGRIFFIMWLGFIGVATVHGFYKVIAGKSPYYQVVLYSALGGFLVGGIVSYIPMRFTQRREIRRACDSINGRMTSAMKRIQPLRKKFAKTIAGFMAAVMSGDAEEAEKQKTEAERLSSLIDVVAEEQMGLVNEPEKEE